MVRLIFLALSRNNVKIRTPRFIFYAIQLNLYPAKYVNDIKPGEYSWGGQLKSSTTTSARPIKDWCVSV